MNFKTNLTHILESSKTVLLIKFKRNEANYMSEKIFKINGIDICTESFGNPKNPAI
ncbi:alpha/beta hydrolase, partial [Bacillus thuringiensis]|nr:alpha/beta hydrolase [Bacillus thuringiensis]